MCLLLSMRAIFYHSHAFNSAFEQTTRDGFGDAASHCGETRILSNPIFFICLCHLSHSHQQLAASDLTFVQCSTFEHGSGTKEETR